MDRPQPELQPASVSRMRWTLRCGAIVDGTGRPAFIGNVVIEGDRIVGVGRHETAGRVCDVRDCIVAPGFIDVRVAWIVPLPDGASLLAPNLQQGITTSIGGNCGISPAPLAHMTAPGALERTFLARAVDDQIGWSWRTARAFFADVERRGIPMNFCIFVGHSTLRAMVMGDVRVALGTPRQPR